MSILDRKCKTEGCWHFNSPVYIYCECCLHGICESFSEEQKEEYKKAIKDEVQRGIKNE